VSIADSVIAEELLYVENDPGSGTDLVNPSFSNPVYVWTTFTIARVQLGSKVRQLKGGQSVGWLEKSTSQFRQLGVCSMTEFFDVSSGQCTACLPKGEQQTFSSIGINTQCTSCKDLGSIRISDKGAFAQLSFICS
jgi:hypothetical protein